MNADVREQVLAYGVAILAAAGALLLRWLLDPILGDNLPLATLYGAVAIAVWYGGYRPAFLATALCYLGANYLFMEPRGAIVLKGAVDLTGLVLFLLSCLIIIALGQGLAPARQHAETGRQDLLFKQKQLEKEAAVRRQAEEELRQRAEETGKLMDLVPLGVFIAHDPACRLITGNREGYELLRLPVGSNLSVTPPPGEEPPFSAHRNGQPLPPDQLPMQLAAAHGVEVRNVEVEFVYPDGTSYTFYGSAAPLFDSQGQVRGSVASFLDITERKRAEEALRQSEERLRTLSDNLPQGAIYQMMGDPDGRRQLLYISAGVERLLGVTPAEAMADAGSVYGLIYEDDRTRVAAEEEATAHNLAPFECEFRSHTRTGDVRWIQCRSAPRYLPTGQVIFEGIVLDVTERKAMEGALKKQNERLGLLWEAASVLLSTDEPDVMMRNLFTRIAAHFGLDTYFSYLMNEAGDALCLESCLCTSDETARSINRLELGQALCGPAARDRQPIVATHLQNSDDPNAQQVKSFGIRAYACYPLLTGDRLLGALSFASRSRDQLDAEELDFLRTICHYVTAAYERLRLIRQLREADQKKDEFLAMLAHELRNPLAPIRNATHVLRLLSPTDPNLQLAWEVIERQVLHLTRLVDDLLDVSRITRRKITLQKERLELAPIVARAVETSRPLLDAHRHDLTVALAAQPVWVEGDATRLAQILANLLNNAAKYTPDGGHVRLTVETASGEAVVRVWDDGVGISADLLPQVFDLFTQGDRSLARSEGGLGIGLTIVKSLVEMHGGSVEARSDGPGRGSEFVVRLPILPALPEAAKDRETVPSSRQSSLSRRVLIVDDNVDAAESLAVLLRLAGYDVRTTYDGASALQVAEAFRPEVVLLDIGLPQMDGYEVARLLRAQVGLTKAVLVAVTGYGQEEDLRRAEEAGFDAHLVKPADPVFLQSLLAGSEAKL